MRDSCFRPRMQGNYVTPLPCKSLKCLDCREYLRDKDTATLMKKIGDQAVYQFEHRGSRDYIRQKIRKMGGEFVFFPRDDHLIVITNVKLGELVSEPAEAIFEAFMGTEGGRDRKVCSSTGWHFTIRSTPLQDTGLVGEDEPSYGCKVSWNDFVAITEAHGFKLRREPGRGYLIEGLEEASVFVAMAWAIEIGRYEIRRKRLPMAA